MKRTRALALIAILAAALGGVYVMQTGDVPKGQPELVKVDSSTLNALRAEFNRNADSLRVILPLSPT